MEVVDSIDNVTVSGPSGWSDLPTMIQKRNSMVPVPHGSQRSTVADRVVVLFVAEAGICRVRQDAPRGREAR